MAYKTQQKFRQTFTVPSTSGAYAFERIAFGEVVASQAPMSFEGVTAIVEDSVTSMVVELWLPRVNVAGGAFVDDDYTLYDSLAAATGGETWPLAGYPGAQIRVKSGGTGGTATINASAF